MGAASSRGQYRNGIRVPLPHLSPFVDNEKEGYVPERAKTIKSMQAAQNQVLPLPGIGEEDQDNLMVEARSELNEVAEKKRKDEIAEKDDNENFVSLMSREKRGLFRAIEINKERKRSKVELPEEKKKIPNPVLLLNIADARKEIHQAACWV